MSSNGRDRDFFGNKLVEKGFGEVYGEDTPTTTTTSTEKCWVKFDVSGDPSGVVVREQEEDGRPVMRIYAGATAKIKCQCGPCDSLPQQGLDGNWSMTWGDNTTQHDTGTTGPGGDCDNITTPEQKRAGMEVANLTLPFRFILCVESPDWCRLVSTPDGLSYYKCEGEREIAFNREIIIPTKKSYQDLCERGSYVSGNLGRGLANQITELPESHPYFQCNEE